MKPPPPYVRPRSIAGLLVRALRLRVRPPKALAALAATALVAALCARGSDAPLRVGTFNIENYPKSPRQEEGAFAAIRSLGAVAVAVQEITDPGAFARAAGRRLGPSWRFAYPAVGPAQRVGVLYDGSALTLTGTRVHREAETYPGAKPAFEARFTDGAGRPLALLVLHLRAGGDGADRRREQLRALRPVIAAGVRGGGRYVVLGDFNATGDGDRDEIAALARATDARWLSRELACTSYWARRDGCLGQALDHVLANGGARSVTAEGPCREFGCRPGASCPAFRDDVSDHCPVLTIFDPPSW